MRNGIYFLMMVWVVIACDQPVEQAQAVPGVVPDSLVMDLIADQHVELVIKNCTACHSAKLVAQNRATRDGWKSMIRWMQSTQNLWDLGEDEDKVLDYLAKNYAPIKTGRRRNLGEIEWYPLDD